MSTNMSNVTEELLDPNNLSLSTLGLSSDTIGESKKTTTDNMGSFERLQQIMTEPNEDLKLPTTEELEAFERFQHSTYAPLRRSQSRRSGRRWPRKNTKWNIFAKTSHNSVDSNGTVRCIEESLKSGSHAHGWVAHAHAHARYAHAHVHAGSPSDGAESSSGGDLSGSTTATSTGSEDSLLVTAEQGGLTVICCLYMFIFSLFFVMQMAEKVICPKKLQFKLKGLNETASAVVNNN